MTSCSLGEIPLPAHAEHLSGYRDSRPARVGNEAWTQVQLDVLGEVLDAVHLLRDDLGELDGRLQELLVGLADRSAAGWSEPDAGMWEARDLDSARSEVPCTLTRAKRLPTRFASIP